jgi:hypothetical protein
MTCWFSGWVYACAGVIQQRGLKLELLYFMVYAVESAAGMKDPAGKKP